MKKSKKWIALFLAALCPFTPLTAFAADVNIDRHSAIHIQHAMRNL